MIYLGKVLASSQVVTQNAVVNTFGVIKEVRF